MAPRLNFKSLLSEADHEYLSALPFIATDDEPGNYLESSLPNGDLNNTQDNPGTILSPTGKELILV